MQFAAGAPLHLWLFSAPGVILRTITLRGSLGGRGQERCFWPRASLDNFGQSCLQPAARLPLLDVPSDAAPAIPGSSLGCGVCHSWMPPPPPLLLVLHCSGAAAPSPPPAGGSPPHLAARPASRTACQQARVNSPAPCCAPLAGRSSIDLLLNMPPTPARRPSMELHELLGPSRLSRDSRLSLDSNSSRTSRGGRCACVAALFGWPCLCGRHLHAPCCCSKYTRRLFCFLGRRVAGLPPWCCRRGRATEPRMPAACPPLGVAS
jgi:hypothetical protein